MTTVYLHGFSGDRSGMQALTSAMKRESNVCVDLPGFGDHVSDAPILDWDEYIDAAVAIINQSVPDKDQLDLVGHSHGAMVAYAIAVKYPERVRHLTLLCPIANGSWVARSFLGFVRTTQKVIGRTALLSVLRHEKVVDIVTFFGRQPGWSDDMYARIRKERRRESRSYTESMIQLLGMVKSYRRIFNETTVTTVPTALVFGRRDVLVSRSDERWYQAHCPTAIKISVDGGHLDPVVAPDMVARELESHFPPAFKVG